MLPVWQEVPHHSVGPGLVLNCAKRQRAEPRVNLYHVSSPFCGRLHSHMYTIRQRQTFRARGFLVMHACVQTHTLSLSFALSLSGLVMYPPFESKVQYVVAIHTRWSKSLCMTRYFSHTFTLSPSIPLSFSVSLTHSLTISQCCYWNVCVCWCGLWNWWMTSHGRFIVRILVQLERKLMASWDYGGLRANTCLFHQETWGHFFTPSQIRATPHHHQHSYF